MKSIQQKINEKGVTKKQVAKMVEINISTLSRIINKSQSYTSDGVVKRINAYLDGLNTNDKTFLENVDN